MPGQASGHPSTSTAQWPYIQLVSGPWNRGHTTWSHCLRMKQGMNNGGLGLLKTSVCSSNALVYNKIPQQAWVRGTQVYESHSKTPWGLRSQHLFMPPSLEATGGLAVAPGALCPRRPSTGGLSPKTFTLISTLFPPSAQGRDCWYQVPFPRPPSTTCACFSWSLGVKAQG